MSFIKKLLVLNIRLVNYASSTLFSRRLKIENDLMRFKQKLLNRDFFKIFRTFEIEKIEYLNLNRTLKGVRIVDLERESLF